MGAAKTLLTAEEFDNYPFEEDKRYELDEGELIEMTRPAFRHNYVLANLQFEVTLYLREKSLGLALLSENLYALSPNTRRSPDLAVILGDRREELEDAKVISIIPDIAAEVLSPSESTRMVHRKLRQYFEAGVKEVWLVDTESEEVEVWTASLPQRTFGRDESLTSMLLPGFELPLKKLFE